MDTRIFNVDLSEIMSRENEKKIPSFVRRIVRFLNSQALDTEGLFRISSKASNLQPLKQRIDNGEELDYSEYKDPHLVPSLFKLFFRELPEPLMTYELYPKFIKASIEYEKALTQQRLKQNSDTFESLALIESYIVKLKSLIDELPQHNRTLLEILLLFLVRVSDHSSKNKMTTSNLATVFGQILFRPETETIDSMMDASRITGIMKFLLERYDKLFTKKVKMVIAKPKEIDLKIDAFTQNEEEEKLIKAKQTVENSILKVQQNLNAISNRLKETDQFEAVADIAVRVQTIKHILFPDDFRMSLNANRLILKSGFAERQGKRRKMEDSYIAEDNLRNEIISLPANQLWAFYAVYDGHGGSKASKMCNSYLHKNIIKSKFFPLGQYSEAIIDAFEVTDKLIIEEEELAGGDKDGSTAVIAFVINTTLYVANAGDSEAILCKLNPNGGVEAEVTTALHRPTVAEEKDRIENAGGAVFSGRVFGKLAVSRALGDGDFKIPTSEVNFVSSEPHVNVIPLTEEYKFILLACDGLFDKVTHQEAIEFLYKQLEENPSPTTACEKLADFALDRGSTDNVTIVLATFNWNS